MSHVRKHKDCGDGDAVSNADVKKPKVCESVSSPPPVETSASEEEGECERATALSSALSLLCDSERQCILHFLPALDRIRVARTCRRWLHACSAALAWKHLDQPLVVPKLLLSKMLVCNRLLRHAPLDMSHVTFGSLQSARSLSLVVTHLSIDVFAHEQTWAYFAQSSIVKSVRVLRINSAMGLLNTLNKNKAFMTARCDFIRQTLHRCLHLHTIEFRWSLGSPSYSQHLRDTNAPFSGLIPSLLVPQLTSLWISSVPCRLNPEQWTHASLRHFTFRMNHRDEPLQLPCFPCLESLELVSLRLVEDAHLDIAFPALRVLTLDDVGIGLGVDLYDVARLSHIPTLERFCMRLGCKYSYSFSTMAKKFRELFGLLPKIQITLVDNWREVEAMGHYEFRDFAASQPRLIIKEFQ